MTTDKTNDTWYGMTYHEDVAAVKDSFKKMLEKGVYKADLFADLLKCELPVIFPPKKKRTK